MEAQEFEVWTCLNQNVVNLKVHAIMLFFLLIAVRWDKTSKQFDICFSNSRGRDFYSVLLLGQTR